MNEPLPRRARNIILAAFTVYLMALALTVKIAPLQDQMDWVLQAKILAHPSLPVAQDYTIRPAPTPNLLGTLAIALAAKALPIFAAARTVYALYLAWFVLAFVYLARSDGRERALVELLGPLYAMNHFFLMGFYNFVLGLAFALFTLGWLRRRADDRSPWTWLGFSLLVTATYLSHFLAFGVLTLGCLAIAWRAYGKDWRAYGPGVAAYLPALIGLAWYIAERGGEFWFHYAFHNPLYYLWYKVGPWAVASGYYPLTPTWAMWVNVTLNAAAIVAVPLLALRAIVNKRAPLRDPLVLTALALTILALAAPTRIFELLRPGQRLLFAAVLLFAATALPGKPTTPGKHRAAALALAALLAWNGYWWLDATRKTDAELKVLAATIPADADMLLLTDSHFHYREPRALCEKLVDPYSYPNSVNPLRYLPYAQIIEHGGRIRSLFGTGIVHAKHRDLLPAINRPWHLSDPARAGVYSHLVATGQADNLADIAQKTSALFAELYRDDYLLIMERIPPAPAD